MTYLKSLLRGFALSMISGFKLSNENYNAALNLLKERLDNKQPQIATHLKNLLKISAVSNLKTFRSSGPFMITLKLKFIV